MFKKSTRIITILMLVAMLLTLFTGVIAEEGEGSSTEPVVEAVKDQAPIANPDDDDENEVINDSAAPTNAATGSVLEAKYTEGKKQLTINVVDEGGDVIETQTIYVKGGFSIQLSITDINYTLVSYSATGCTYASAVLNDRYLSSTALFGTSKSGTITMNVKANAGLYTLADILQMNTKSGKQTVKLSLYDTNNKLLGENTALSLQRVANWTEFDIIDPDYKIARIETDGCTFAKNPVACTQNHLEGNFTYNRQGAEIKVFVEKTN